MRSSRSHGEPAVPSLEAIVQLPDGLAAGREIRGKRGFQHAGVQGQDVVCSMVVLLLPLHTSVSVDIGLGIHLGSVKTPTVLENGHLIVPSESVPASFPGGEAILVQTQERGCRQAAATVDGPVELTIDIPDAGTEVLEGGQAGGKHVAESLVLQSDG